MAGIHSLTRDMTETVASAAVSRSLTEKIGEAPTGYSVDIQIDPVTGDNEEAFAFNIDGGEIGATYNYSITSSGGGTAVTGSGTIENDPEEIENVDVSGLGDGTLTVSVYLTDATGNVGTPVTATAEKDTA